jgi:hypothetical protein
MSELRDAAAVKRMFGFFGGRRHQQDSEWGEKKRCDINRRDLTRIGVLALGRI